MCGFYSDVVIAWDESQNFSDSGWFCNISIEVIWCASFYAESIFIAPFLHRSLKTNHFHKNAKNKPDQSEFKSSCLFRVKWHEYHYFWASTSYFSRNQPSSPKILAYISSHPYHKWNSDIYFCNNKVQLPHLRSFLIFEFSVWFYIRNKLI